MKNFMDKQKKVVLFNRATISGQSRKIGRVIIKKYKKLQINRLVISLSNLRLKDLACHIIQQIKILTILKQTLD
jgi:hypothetical protein